MKIKKINYIIFLLTLFLCSTMLKSKIIHIESQTEKDLELRKKMRDLFFKEGGSNEQRIALTEKAINKYDANKIFIETEDSIKIAAVYFKRLESKVNIICIDGFFPDGKEWLYPYALLFPNENIITFDLRGYGESEGKVGSSWYGAESYSTDIQAVIDFIRKDNDKPIVLNGICFGAAMAMYTTIKAKQSGRSIANALAFSSIWLRFEDMYRSAIIFETPFWLKFLYKIDYFNLMKKYFNLKTMGESLFSTLNPIDMIENINLPCWFAHYTSDKLAPLKNALELYDRVKGFKIFFQSDIGSHSLLHSYVPYQYQQAYYDFLKGAGLID